MRSGVKKLGYALAAFDVYEVVIVANRLKRNTQLRFTMTLNAKWKKIMFSKLFNYLQVQLKVSTDFLIYMYFIERFYWLVGKNEKST